MAPAIETTAPERVLMLGEVTRQLCLKLGVDQAEGTMMLLTAAVRLVMQNLKPGHSVEDVVSDALGNAIIAAKDFFKKDTSDDPA